ncbi:MFS transporter [Kineococcus gypseus]|uniref:MFS transporter n=1 Tax=Kineococcus gypseus TaxID=1637102 RepID=UPI003D7C752A
MSAGTAPAVPQLALASARGRWLLVVAVLGSALAQLEATVVNVALPSIGADLDAGVSGLQWVLNAYLLALASLVLLGGAVGDRFGRRRTFVAGALLFCLASTGCALAPTLPLLVVARAVQGVGAALLVPGSLAVLESMLRPADRARAIGSWSALGGIAGAVGPLLGGLLVESSWRAVFLLPVPLGLLAAAAAVRHLPEPRPAPRPPTGAGDPRAQRERAPLDAAGAVLTVLALGGLTYALVRATTGPWGLVAAALAVGVSAALALVLVERRHPEPLVPPAVLASSRFVVANAVTFAVYAGLGGVFFLLVVQLQNGLGYSPLQAGAATVPMTLVLLLLSSRAGRLAQRTGPRLPLTAGPVLMAAGMLLMRRIEPGASYLGDVLPAVLVVAVGLSATVAPVTATALAAAPAAHAGAASGVSNAVARTAQLAAVSGLPLLVGLSGEDYTDPQALSRGFAAAVLACAVLALLGAGIAWTGLRSPDPAGGPSEQRPTGPAAALHPMCCPVDAPPPRVRIDSRDGRPLAAGARTAERSDPRTRRAGRVSGASASGDPHRPLGGALEDGRP